MKTSRRHFLQGLTISISGTASGLMLWPSSLFAEENTHSLAALTTRDKVVIIEDKAIFNSSESLNAYLPAIDLASSTRKYTQELDQETFLSRHWFV